MAREEKEKMTRVYVTNADSMLKFFEILQHLTGELKMKDTPKLRMWLMNYMADHGYIDRMYDTSRTKDQVVEDFKNHGYNIDDRRKP